MRGTKLITLVYSLYDQSSACCTAMLGHNLRTQAFLVRPWPPNFAIARQALHSPQSGNWQASHTPHLFLLKTNSWFVLSNWFVKKLSNVFLTRGVVVAFVHAFLSTFLKSIFVLIFRFPNLMPMNFISSRMQGNVINGSSSSSLASTHNHRYKLNVDLCLYVCIISGNKTKNTQVTL